MVVQAKVETLFDAVGGLPTLRRVHKLFYDKIYAHPVLQQFFAGHSQEAIENRQTQFMGEKMGGRVFYPGREPKIAHRAMYITAEHFAMRQQLLREAMQEAGVPADLQERWLKLDAAFKPVIVKDSVAAFYRTSWRFEKRVFAFKPPSV